jgi:hypothetical protein
MEKLNKKLRALKPGQIVVAAAAAWLLGVSVLIFGLLPLTTMLLLAVSEPVAAVGSFIVAVGGGLAAGNFVGRVFGKAYYDRKFDDELQEAYVTSYPENYRHDG